MPNDTFATVSNKTRRCRSTYQIRRVRQGGKEWKTGKSQRGAAITRCLLNQKGQGRAGQGRWDESGPLLCCALSGCQAGVLELSACRGYRLCGVVYGYN